MLPRLPRNQSVEDQGSIPSEGCSGLSDCGHYGGPRSHNSSHVDLSLSQKWFVNVTFTCIISVFMAKDIQGKKRPCVELCVKSVSK